MISLSQPPDGSEYAALIFDWDGTLVDSRVVCFEALARAMADAGVTLDPSWYWPRQAVASPDLLKVWESEFGALPQPTGEIIDRCRIYVQAAAHQLKVVDHVVDIARAAHARGQRLAIGSNASTDTVAAGLQGTGLRTLFDVVVTWSDVPPGRGKPAPDIFLLAASKLGVAPGRCLVYEDAEIGIEAAVAAGMSAYDVNTSELHTIGNRPAA
ncbi:HAD family phosphatase [Longispora sp. NPDC051575]|uniref:HAD family hydrolase n=1 Tax=Longispora sp. NPDC051575 TaxID=3154943 RepID=UPI0034372B60